MTRAAPVINLVKTVTKRFRQLLSCYLALCVSLAGAIGISPVLHRLVEHGGQGPLHVHYSAPITAEALAQPQDQASMHPVRAHFAAQARSHESFAHASGGLDCPRIRLSRALHALTHFLDGGASSSSERAAPGAPAGHRHGSLAQLMASGLVNQFAAISLLPPIPAPVLPNRSASISVWPETPWDAQSASRGPPASPS